MAELRVNTARKPSESRSSWLEPSHLFLRTLMNDHNSNTIPIRVTDDLNRLTDILLRTLRSSADPAGATAAVRCGVRAIYRARPPLSRSTFPPGPCGCGVRQEEPLSRNSE